MDDAKRVNGARVSVRWRMTLGVVCLGAAVFVFNLMAHALWMSGHPVEGGGEAGAAWGRRADIWLGVLVVLLGVVAWCVWGVVRKKKRGARA
ncbi:MAG: hypothetical protein ACIAQF_05635 [Phycisphaerales bacterium JB065]